MDHGAVVLVVQLARIRESLTRGRFVVSAAGRFSDWRLCAQLPMMQHYAPIYAPIDFETFNRV
jgi:hypothetical protein